MTKQDSSSECKSDVKEALEKLHATGVIQSANADDLSQDELVLLGRKLMERKPVGEPRRKDAPMSPSTEETRARLAETMAIQALLQG